MRILVTGTSIASFDRSSVLIAASHLQNIYGRNNTRIVWPALSGGNYDTDHVGRQKQVYGGAPYIRMAMKPGDIPYTARGFVNGFRVVWGEESGSGSFEISVDGFVVHTASAGATQSYNNVYEWLDPSGLKAEHALSVAAAATGNVYLERIELVDTGPGVFVENATMGAAGFNNMYNLFANGDPSNMAGIPIVGKNGVNAWFGRTDVTRPHLILAEQDTNDNQAQMSLTLADIPARTMVPTITPVVLMNEMPAMSFLSGNVLSAARQAMHDEMAATAAAHGHIAYLDWAEALRGEWSTDQEAYRLRYLAADGVHPNAAGYSTTYGMLADLFNVPHPGVETTSELPGTFAPADAEGVNPFGDDPYALIPVALGSVRDESSPYGSVMTAVGRAVNFTDNAVSATVFASSTLPNLLSSVDLSGGVHPVYGAYKDYSNEPVGEIRSLTANDTDSDFTILLLASSNSPFGIVSARMVNPGNNEEPLVAVNGTVVDKGTNGEVTYLPQDRPVFVYLTIRRGSPADEFLCEINLSDTRLYGAWAVEGSVPVIANRTINSALMGFPVFDSALADNAPADVLVGQVFHTLETPKIKKRALDAVVYKPLQKAFGRGYELLNKDDAGVFFAEMEVRAPGEDSVFIPRAGGLMTTTAEGYEVILGFASNGQVMTLGLRAKGHILRILMHDGGGGNRVSLSDTGVWQDGSGAIMFLPRINTENMNLGFTFALPTGEQATALGTNPTIQYDFLSSGGVPGLGVATLVSGASACMLAI